MFRLVLQTALPTEETSCCDYPEVLEELQSQEVLPGHQERLLQTAGTHQGPGAEQEDEVLRAGLVEGSSQTSGPEVHVAGTAPAAHAAQVVCRASRLAMRTAARTA